MAFVGKRRYCVFGCDALGAYLHSFPHPERKSELFKKWVSVVGEKLTEKDPWKIYKNKKICGHHFTADQKVASHRLLVSAVPSINLDGVFQCPAVLVQLEHNYCIPGTSASGSVHHESSNREPQLLSSSAITTDKDLLARLEPINQPSTSQCTDFKGEKSYEHIIKKYKMSQKENRKLKTQLRKSKKHELQFKARLENAEKALASGTALDKVTKNMTLSGKIFTGIQYRQATKKPKGRRYNTEEKILALSIFKKSPKCYGYLSKYFRLPSTKSLKILLSDIKLKPGVNKIIFEKLKETVGGLNIEDRLCTLMFDEMALEPHILYDSARDELKGFVSHNEDDLKIANHALVFMIKGIKMNYKQPVAYYFTQSLKTSELKSIINDVVKHVHSTGLRILCTVCDQGATNVSTINSLIDDTKRVYLKNGKEWREDMFEVNGRKIIPLYDVPHLLKGLRNNLLTKDLIYTDFAENKEKCVKWEYFEMLYKADEACGELRYLHKLTEEHVVPSKIKKMRVKLAAQVFSHSVAATANHLVERKMLPEECRQLIPMVLIIDKLFDSLNASTFHVPNGKVYRGAVKKNSPHHQLWQDGIKFLKSVKFIAKKKVGNKIWLTETSAPSIKNFIKTIQGMQSLWTILNKKYSMDCMLTRNFNQDPVENFFGNIRSLGIRNVSPNCWAFEGAFKTLLLNNFSCQQAVNANCEEDFNTCLQNLKFFIKEKEKFSEIRTTKQSEVIHISEQLYETLSNVPTDASSSRAQSRYVCGWVLKKCFTRIKSCKYCKQTLISSDELNNANNYLRVKEYYKNQRGLIHPSDPISYCFNEIQDVTATFLKTSLKVKQLKENIKLLVNSFVTFPFKCDQHKDRLQNYFIESTINVIIYSWCRSINRILTGKITNNDTDDPVKTKAQIYYNTHKLKSK